MDIIRAVNRFNNAVSHAALARSCGWDISLFCYELDNILRELAIIGKVEYLTEA